MKKCIIDTQYGDLSKKGMYNGSIEIYNDGVGTLEGSPKTVKGNFVVCNNSLTNLEFSPSLVAGRYDVSYNKLTELSGVKDLKVGTTFDCTNNPTLKDPIKEIIKNRIRAKRYFTDEGIYAFEDIEEEFNSYIPLDKRVTRSSMRTLLGLDK